MYMYFHLYDELIVHLPHACCTRTHEIKSMYTCTRVHTTIMCTHICVYTCMSNQWTTSLWIKRQARCYIQSHPLGFGQFLACTIEWSGNGDCYIVSHEMHSCTLSAALGWLEGGDCYPNTKCSHALTCLTAFCAWDSSPHFQQVWYWSKHIMLSEWLWITSTCFFFFQRAMVHCSGIYSMYICMYTCVCVWGGGSL